MIPKLPILQPSHYNISFYLRVSFNNTVCNATHYEIGPLITICTSGLINEAVFMPFHYSAEYVVPSC
jgi:hypothetical protein